MEMFVAGRLVRGGLWSRWTRAVVTSVVVAGAVGVTSGAGVAGAVGSPTVVDCLSRPSSQQTVTGEGTRSDSLRVPSPPADHTFDLRGTVFLGQQDANVSPMNVKPLNFGVDVPSSGLCVVGGYVKGTHSRDLDWEYLKHDPGGGDRPALRIAGSGPTVVDGLRVDNMMNGFRPMTDGVEVRNAYFAYIRDDCMENDSLRDVRIVDSLFDGCYVAFSQRPDTQSGIDPNGPRDDSVLEIERVLIRMQRMPGGFRMGPDEESYGHIWKWSDATGPAVIRDSIIMAEDIGHDDLNDLDWPANVTAHNVTLVWTGTGPYPGKLPASGVTVTTDEQVWHDARTDWLTRHGCTDIDHCDPEQITQPAAAQPGTFVDVTGSVHAGAIERLAEQGVVAGCRAGWFCPDEVVTRAQMATLVTRALGLESRSAPPFSDVPAAHPHASGIAAVAAAGVAGGFGDGTFRPGAAVTREQMATILHRALGIDPRWEGRFVDTATSVHREAIDGLAAAGITAGCDRTRFCPAAPVRRDQMATFLDRALVYGEG